MVFELRRLVDLTMVRATVTNLFSVDIPVPLTEYKPEDPGNFSLLVRALVGPYPGEGEESFDIVVCTPAWIDSACEKHGFVVGLHHVVVSGYEWAFIEQTLIKLIETCSGSSWNEVARKLAKIGQWEFDSYYKLTNSQS